MKKVLIVSTVGLQYDGITNIIVSYLQAMNLEGLDIYIAGTIIIKHNIRKQLENCGCKVIEFPNRRTETGKYFTALTKFIRAQKIEVIHAHGNSGTLAIEMLAAYFGGCKKRIAHSHNTKCSQAKVDRLLRPVFNLFYTDGLACGEAAGKWLFGNRPFKIIINGRNIEKYAFNQQVRENVRKSLNIGNELAIGHVGGFVEQKNHTFLVNIFKELRRLNPECKLFMIGDGPLKPKIEKMCEGINVTFTDAVDNISDYLNAMDGMLLPSFFEGIPLVAIEWQINGLPCILSDSISKECSFMDNCIFMSTDEAACLWAKKILLMINRDKRKQNSDKAQKTAYENDFGLMENADKLRRIYLSEE